MASAHACRTDDIVKASWMHRQSDFLSRWKWSFCVQYKNGTFAYYKDEKRGTELGSINAAKSCYAINVGTEVKSTTPPQGKNASCLLELRSHENNMVFCVDSIDDAHAWKSTILEVKTSLTVPAQPVPAQQVQPFQPPPPYTAQPPPMAPPSYNPSIVVPQPSQVVVAGRGTTTYTTYLSGNQYVIPPVNQTLVVRRQPYPVQNTVYTYPGQVCTLTQPAVQGTTTYVYQSR